VKIEMAINRGVLVVRVSGQLDVHTSPQFSAQIDKAWLESGAKNLLVNFCDTTFVDSSGLGAIMGRFKKVKACGGKMVCCDLQPQVAQVLNFAGIYRLCGIERTESEAMEKLLGNRNRKY